MGHDRGRHTLTVLLAAALWGTTGTIAHHAPRGSSQLLIGLSTFGFGALALLAIDARGVARLVTSSNRRTVTWLVVGALGVLAYASMYYLSMDLVGVAVGNVLALGSGPVFAALFELIIDRRAISRGWAIATAVAIAGIALLTGGAEGRSGSSPILGVSLALGAGAGYALYSYAAARLIHHGSESRSAMAAVFAVAAIVLIPWFFIGHPGPLLSAHGVVVLAYLAVIPMAAAYLLFGYGLRGLPASSATTLALAEPLVATLLATTLLHERLVAASWAGLGLIIVGLVLVARAELRYVPS